MTTAEAVDDRPVRRIALPSDDQFRAAIAKHHLLGWAKFTDAEYLRPRHIRHLAERLMAAERYSGQRIVVQMPPRHGKTELSSVKFPAWFLGRNPNKRVILAAHTAQLASTISRRIRNEFAEYAGGVWGLKVSGDSSAVDRWDIEGHKGGIIAAGIGGPITGHGADLLIIDDPVKSAEDAYSRLQRERVWDWYTHVARTRLHSHARAVLIMTRWHEDDLAGRILSSFEKWELLSLAALAEEDDPLGREVGEALWPAKFNEEDLAKIRAAIGSHVFNALYQQRPAPAEGNVFKRAWLRHYVEHSYSNATFTDYIISWDMTFKDAAKSDFVVGQVWARYGAKKFLIDQVRGRMDFPATIKAVVSLAEKYPEATILIEDTANGPAVIATLRDKVPRILPVTPKGSKYARATAVAADFEAGNVHLPSTTRYPWVTDFVDELTAFPEGAHDDQVDACSQALSRYQRTTNYADIAIDTTTGTRDSPWRL